MTMPGYRTQTPLGAPPPDGLSRASLGLGIAGLAGLALCLAGVLPAVAGLVVGVLALRRGQGRPGLAKAGVALSAVALVVAAVAVYALLSKAATCGDRERYPDHAARDRCIEREFPFTGRASGG
ncbi:hypothetical protein [Actinomadura flavalba]|uniref:hypothetical protein n=1 Tax=Actinomadura flavalba TaxID=1120938 RepID=UPI00037A3B50|nr:hypothetical protein [Actinomadura flavalba]